ncbi:septin-2 isoform X2 [Rhipicephalus sanguineus]|uniref:septin-2 isoform X2 n=1 Tax=Rhipicephalus sanguineus TaxID=34632 RepID=UPI0018935EEA|nr:septin-2 isoform X2 [Rhipicephalus sanguineus]
MPSTDLRHSPCPSEGEIGFATLPEQVHRKSVKRGFDFTLMVVGESGLGKSTLINSLFLTDLYEDRKLPNAEVSNTVEPNHTSGAAHLPNEKIDRTVQIERKTMEIEEKGVRLRLTVVDTPGFGDAVNCEESWRSIDRYIDEQFNQFFKDESGLNRKNIVDNRVHCCLYFIPPWGHGLRQLDIEFMKRLHQKVNIVPVIAKADTLTPTEVRQMKDRVLRELEEHQVTVYQLPECDSDEDDDIKLQDRELKESIPFAVISSTQVVDINGRRVRGRLYPWGIVEVENPKHSDFLKLRTFLISTHMQDLKEVTRDVHYENYRAQYIQKISQQAARERGKPGRDSVTTTYDGISEADRLLQMKDEEIRRMQEMLSQMQEKLRQTSRDTTPEASTPDLDARRDGDSVVNL